MAPCSLRRTNEHALRPLQGVLLREPPSYRATVLWGPAPLAPAVRAVPLTDLCVLPTPALSSRTCAAGGSGPAPVRDPVSGPRKHVVCWDRGLGRPRTWTIWSGTWAGRRQAPECL